MRNLQSLNSRVLLSFWQTSVQSSSHVVLDKNVTVNMSCVYIKEKIYELIIIILATLHK